MNIDNATNTDLRLAIETIRQLENTKYMLTLDDETHPLQTVGVKRFGASEIAVGGPNLGLIVHLLVQEVDRQIEEAKVNYRDLVFKLAEGLKSDASTY
jgi:hypothetical protein